MWLRSTTCSLECIDYRNNTFEGVYHIRHGKQIRLAWCSRAPYITLKHLVSYFLFNCRRISTHAIIKWITPRQRFCPKRLNTIHKQLLRTHIILSMQKPSDFLKLSKAIFTLHEIHRAKSKVAKHTAQRDNIIALPEACSLRNAAAHSTSPRHTGGCDSQLHKSEIRAYRHTISRFQRTSGRFHIIR